MVSSALLKAFLLKGNFFFFNKRLLWFIWGSLWLALLFFSKYYLSIFHFVNVFGILGDIDPEDFQKTNSGFLLESAALLGALSIWGLYSIRVIQLLAGSVQVDDLLIITEADDPFVEFLE